MHLPCAAPCGGLACGGWRPALDSDVGVPRNELASSSPFGDERAAGPTRFFIARARFEFSRSRVFIASFGRRGRPSPLQLRATCCRIRLRLFRHAATSVLRGLPAFYRSGAFCAFPASFHVALGLRGRWGLLRHRGPGRRLASASIAATPRRRAVGSSARVGGRRRCARAPWAVFFLSPCVGRGAHRRVTVLEDSARTAVGVLSSAARWQSGHLLRAPGRGSAFLRRPRSVLMRRTGHFLVGFEGRPTFVQHSRAVDVADRKSGRDLSAFWRSLAVVVPPARLRCTLAARWAGQRRIVRSSLFVSNHSVRGGRTYSRDKARGRGTRQRHEARGRGTRQEAEVGGPRQRHEVLLHGKR